jgi:glyoxylase-like metal-dependent hydrolase (beta-lactamase superfamily II)
MKDLTLKTFVIHPATFKLDGGAMFGIIPKPLWSKKIQPDESNRILMSLRVIYIETKNKKILIDTGIGDYHSEKFTHQFEITSSKSPLTQILQDDFKVAPDEITDIILTHLHFDHVGGLGSGEDGTTPIFKNATLHVHKNHYEYALNPTLRDAGSFQTHFFKPLIEHYISKNQINFVDTDSGTLLKDGDENIGFDISFGHTPYMIHPIFDKKIYMADLVPMKHHVKIPWVMGYDIEPGTTTVYKQKFYNRIMQEELVMLFEHDLDTIGGKLAKNDRGQYVLKDEIKPDESKTMELN